MPQNKHSECCDCYECVGDFDTAGGRRVYGDPTYLPHDHEDYSPNLEPQWGNIQNPEVERICLNVLTAVRAITADVRTDAEKKQKGKKSMKIPKPKGGTNGNSQYAPFMKPKDVGKGGKLTIVGNVREGSSQFGESMNVDVKFGGKSYTLSVRIDGANHRKLYERFGANPKKWKGVVNVAVLKSSFGNKYIAVQD